MVSFQEQRSTTSILKDNSFSSWAQNHSRLTQQTIDVYIIPHEIANNIYAWSTLSN